MITDIVLTEELNGFAVGLFPEIARISGGKGEARVDGLIKVDELKTDPFQITGIARADQESLFACGWEGVVARSADAGASWTAVEPVRPQCCRPFISSRRSIGWAAGNEGVIVATRDGGVHWEKQNSPVQRIVAGGSFPERNARVRAWTKRHAHRDR